MKVLCNNCIHETICQEVNNLKCRQKFIWYSGETGCPHYRDKSQLKATFKCTSENCPMGFNANWCTLHDCEYRTVPQTNFDKITSSVESLAEIMANALDCTSCPCANNGCFGCDSCEERIKEWLEQESE